MSPNALANSNLAQRVDPMVLAVVRLRDPGGARLGGASRPGCARRDTSAVLVTVNDKPITENQLAIYRFLHRLPAEETAESRKADLEQLIENELLRQFLADRRAEVDPQRLAAAVKAAKEQLKRQNRDPDKVFQNSRLLDALLRRELSLPMAWQVHLGRVLTQQTIRDEFEHHRSDFDGTEVRASQILSEAARIGRRRPSASGPRQARPIACGDCGGENQLRRRGKTRLTGPQRRRRRRRRLVRLPRKNAAGDSAKSSFGSSPARSSAPFRTKFGLHLYTVTKVRPGNLNLEDVRASVIARMSRTLWEQFAAQAKKTAKVDWKSPQ